MNISDPHNAVILKTIGIPEGPWGTMIDDDRLYIGSFNGTLVYDISEVVNPVYITTLLRSQETLSASGIREQLYITVSDGVSALNVVNATEPVNLGHFTIQDGCHDIQYSSGYAYTVKEGLYILRIRED